MNRIIKIGAILIKNRKILVVRNKGRDVFMSLGGKIENEESDEECLKRELKEEIDSELVSSLYFNTFEDEAFFDKSKKLELRAYFVNISGNPKASSEVEELRYVCSKDIGKIKMGSIISDFIIPELKEKGIID